MAKKKEKKKSLIERLSQVNRKTWRVILVIAIAVMVIPVILDILLDRFELLGRTCDEEVAFLRRVDLRLDLGGIRERDVHLAAGCLLEGLGNLGERISHACTTVNVQLRTRKRCCARRRAGACRACAP